MIISTGDAVDRQKKLETNQKGKTNKMNKK